MSSRLPLLPGWITKSKLSKEQFYTLALKHVTKRRGLIHGVFSKGNRVCAVGAVAAAMDKINKTVSVDDIHIEALQRKNDSCPNDTPAERRQKVIEWLKKELAK